MEIKQELTKVNYTPMTNKKNEYIVIHYVGAVSSAKNNADYFYSVNRNASANYFVDENEIWQVVKDSDKAWHVGADKYYNDCRNSNSIGIEMCCYMNNGVLDIKEEVVERTIELTKELMAKYNIPADRVVRHYDVTRKVCPAPFVNNPARWDDFKVKLGGQPAPQPTPTDKISVDGIWGVGTTKKAQKVFGTYVDGIVSNQYSAYKTKNPGLLSSTFDWKNSPSKNGSVLIKAIQRQIGVSQDGFIGDSTIRAMQRWLGTPVDGKVSYPSVMVKEFQKWLNQR